MYAVRTHAFINGPHVMRCEVFGNFDLDKLQLDIYRWLQQHPDVLDPRFHFSSTTEAGPQAYFSVLVTYYEQESAILAREHAAAVAAGEVGARG